MEDANIQIYVYHDNGSISDDAVTLPNVKELRKRFDLFVDQLDSAMPNFTEFHCKVVQAPPENADRENPEELMTVVV